MRAVSASTSAENGVPDGGMISDETRGAIQPIISTRMARPLSALPPISRGTSEPGSYHADKGLVGLRRLLRGHVGLGRLRRRNIRLRRLYRRDFGLRRGHGSRRACRVVGRAEAAIIVAGFIRIVGKREV